MQKYLGKIQKFLGFSSFIERQLTQKHFSNKNVKNIEFELQEIRI